MRTRTFRTIGVAAVAALGGAFALGAPAAAENTVGNVTFYEAADFGQENGGYPAASDWFFGNISSGEGAATFNSPGLTLTGKKQILRNYENTHAEIARADLEGLISTSKVVVDGTAHGQIPLFFNYDGNQKFTTLRTANAESPAMATDWKSSSAIGTAIVAQGTYSLDAILTALYDGGTGAPKVDLLGFGYFVDTAAEATIYAVSLGGQWNVFQDDAAAVPTDALVSDTFSAADFTTDGVTFTGQNWIPGTSVTVSLTVDGEVYEETGQVDNDGNISVVLNPGLELEPGSYSVRVTETLGESELPVGLFSLIGFFNPDGLTHSFEITASEEPTVDPTEEPTVDPTEEPTVDPTEEPTDVPTEEPTDVPTEEPTDDATEDDTLVVGDESSGGALPETGTTSAPLLAIGGFALLIGVGVLAVRRRLQSTNM